MKEIKWNKKKNKWLRKMRGICFEDFIDAIEKEDIIDDVDNKNYPNQRIMIIQKGDYVFTIPYVKNEDDIFLKTIIPSRKETKKYLKRKENQP